MLVESVVGLAPGVAVRDKANGPAVRVPREQLLVVARQLRDDPVLAFDLLVDHTAVDWLAEGCFELLYTLYSTTHGHTLLVTVLVPRDDPTVPTVCDLWPIAQWQEREVYDLLGVLYDEHPDLRRLFLEDGWVGFPLRKDYRDDDRLELPR
jgi:NADH/F420H2 dehydrogenase subunit C